VPVPISRLDLAMAALFAFAAAVQLNDPDPVRWVTIYVAASALSFAAVRARHVPAVAFVAVGVTAMLWGVLIALGGPGASEYGHMFDAWEMRSLAVEEAREASGLTIVAVWMTVLAVRAARRTRTAPVRG